jgi:hypothetical protein
MTRTFAEDYALGKKREVANLPLVSRLMKKEMKQTDKFCPMDFVAETDESVYAEHKHRTYSFQQLCRMGGVFVGDNKVQYLKNKQNAQCDFFFELTDGIYRIPYSPDFHTFPTKIFTRDARPDKPAYPSKVVLIPMEKLVKV